MIDLTQLAMFKQKDIEKLFAACVFVNPVDTIQACGWLSPGMIINDQVRGLWAATLQRIGAGDEHEQASGVVLQIALEQGLASELAGWVADVTYSHLPGSYANEIARRAYLVGISSGLGELVQALQQQDDNKVSEVIQRMAGAKPAGSVKLPTAFDVAEKFERAVRSKNYSISTYLSRLDDATGGIERQTLFLLAGRPSTGKTALAFQVARQAAYAGQRVLFFQLEMSDTGLWSRAACPAAGVTWRDVRAGKASADQLDTMISESYKLAANYGDNLYIIQAAQTTESIWKATIEYRPDLVIVDHVRLLKDRANPGETENKRQGRISQALKELAKATNSGMLALAQLNRNAAPGNTETGIPEVKRPSLNDLRDSGEHEENADVVLMLNFADGFQPKATVNPVEAWVRKFRDGPRDVRVDLLFDTRQEWFTCKNITEAR